VKSALAIRMSKYEPGVPIEVEGAEVEDYETA
jgi:hypothetical protein